MKRIITVLLLSAAMLAFNDTKAQANFIGTTTKPGTATSTTITGFSVTVPTIEVGILDAAIDTLGLTLSGTYNSLIKVTARVLKTSGTIAGTVRLYGSNYGTTSTWHAIGDTLTLSNAAVNDHDWNLTGNDTGWKYLRILQSGGTTMVGTLSVRALGLKP